MADLLGSFFESTFVEEPAGEIPSLEDRVPYEITDLVIVNNHVKKALEGLNTSKSQGPDMVHPKLLKSLSGCPAFVQALTKLFQDCYDWGIFPSDWRTATVTALHKKGDRLNAKNYRPISLTCIASKCFERILRDHVMIHVERYIAFEQHGFRHGRSCLSNLLDSMYRAYSLIEEDGEMDIIYLDFMKAFDSVPHKRLTSKLRCYGITGKSLSIINAFLSNREFAVKIGDTT